MVVSDEAFTKASIYVRRALIMNEPLSGTIGPSNLMREEMMPMPPSVLYSLLLPSSIFTSSTDDKRPPYCAGMPPLYRLTSFMASELKVEKKPNRCDAL